MGKWDKSGVKSKITASEVVGRKRGSNRVEYLGARKKIAGRAKASLGRPFHIDAWPRPWIWSEMWRVNGHK